PALAPAVDTEAAVGIARLVCEVDGGRATERAPHNKAWRIRLDAAFLQHAGQRLVDGERIGQEGADARLAGAPAVAPVVHDEQRHTDLVVERRDAVVVGRDLAVTVK